MYRHLAACMPADQPVYALRAPDFGGNYREVNLRGLARKYLDDIRAVQPAGPYQLCGLSFGGLLADEMATQLIETGEQRQYRRSLRHWEFSLLPQSFVSEGFAVSNNIPG